MRLVSYRHEGDVRLGVLVGAPGGEEVVDLRGADASIPAGMIEFLTAGESALSRAREVAASAPAGTPLPEVNLLAPVPRPGKILCIGSNYADHVAESGMDLPEYLEVFPKFTNAIVGHEEPIVLPTVDDEVDYECELAFVIGRTARHVSRADGESYVAGYMPFHDVSARAWQFRTSQWTLGKSMDTFAPMGPALVTADEVADPHALGIRTRVNGETLQDSNTKHLIFRIPDIVAEISAAMTLDPGDVIATGTPPGVGFARTPPIYLKAGDVVEIEIDGLGTLRNPVVAS